MLTLQNLSLKYKQFNSTEVIFSNVSIHAEAGDLIGVSGGSGSGKSSLLMSLGSQLAPSFFIDGDIILFGKKVNQGEVNNDVALVTENPYSQSSGLKSKVIGELVLPLEMRGCEKNEMRHRVDDIALLCGLNSRIDSRLEWLSGGETQRLNVGTALISQPKLLLLDQAFTELDQAFRTSLLKLLKVYAKDNSAIVVVSFSPLEISPDGFDKFIYLKNSESVKSKSNKVEIHDNNDRTLTISKTRDILKVEEIYYRYPKDSDWLIRNLNFSMSSHEGLFLLGSNGSGKSTFAKLLLGTLKPQKGSIKVLDKIVDINQLTLGKVSCAFQNPDLYFCKSTVLDELEHAYKNKHANYAYGILSELLELTSLLQRNPYDLSRGQRKRLSIALAAKSNPIMLFLDEPSQYQDDYEVSLIIRAITEMIYSGTSIIIATHDQRLLCKFAEFRHITL